MVTKYVVEVKEVWVVSRKYYTFNNSKEEAIEAYAEGCSIEAFEDYEVLVTRFDDKLESGYEITDVYED